MKLSFLTKALLGGIVTASIFAGSLIATLPVRATGVETMSVTPATQYVANGATNITVSIVANTAEATRGWGAELDFNPSQLQETGFTYGSTFYASTYGTISNIPPVVNNTAGTITDLAQTVLGNATSGGPTGTGTLVTIFFRAVTPSGNNSVDAITLNSGVVGTLAISGLADVNANPIATTLVNGTVVVGIPLVPDLVVSAISTTPSNGSSSTYALNFTVANNGTAAAAASSATYAVNGGTAVTESVGALAASANQTFNVPLTVSASGTDSIVVTADSSNLYNETNNTATITYTELPDLVVSAISTSPASSSSSPSTTPTYTVSYTITNNGPAAAGASSTSIVINGGTPITISCPALANGASNSQTTATQTVAGNDDVIVVTANSTGAVTAWNTTNNTATINYYYAPSGSWTYTQSVSGTLGSVFSFTAPAAVTTWTYSGNTNTPSAAFTPGESNTNAVADNMVVSSSGPWYVTASGQNGGFMSAWSTSSNAYASPLISLTDPLEIFVGTNQSSTATLNEGATGAIDLTNAAQLVANGSTNGLTSGYSRTIPVTFTQPVLYSDPALTAGYVYQMTVTYVATAGTY